MQASCGKAILDARTLSVGLAIVVGGEQSTGRSRAVYFLSAPGFFQVPSSTLTKTNAVLLETGVYFHSPTYISSSETGLSSKHPDKSTRYKSRQNPMHC